MSNPPGGNARTIPVQFVRGVGPKRAEALHAAGIFTVFDLLLHIPRRYLDRSSLVPIRELRRHVPGAGLPVAAVPEGEGSGADIRTECTVLGTVRSFRVLGAGRKARMLLVLSDETGSVQCVWFGGVGYWRKAFRVGETLAVSGQPSLYGGIVQFVHPDIDRIASPGADRAEATADWGGTLRSGGLVPLYPSSQELARVGFDGAGLRRALHSATNQYLDAVPEALPAWITEARGLPPLRDSVRKIHFPGRLEDLRGALRRLKYEELFRFQLRLALKRKRVREETPGIPFVVRSLLARRLVDSLPFTLTAAQRRVIKEISSDMESPHPMNRLLQGDVGSGKTVVALTAMLVAVDNGYQAAVMAPTEILAEQHFRTLSRLASGLPVSLRLLTGGRRGALRRDVLDDVREGKAQIVVGTHALFEKAVTFASLGIVVIDEQHRFGVLQRAALRQKGQRADVLVMTATPIPRTLSLTLYGDLDVSVIDELPRGRKPVRTLVRDESERASVYEHVREEVRRGRQVYFVYPIIEQSEKLALRAATVHYESLSTGAFPDLRVGLLHGRMTPEEKETTMGRFQGGEIDILVATTVIEVGIDVPNASLMVIENAERFGLSQLHQLRGRVGRGDTQATCVLLTRRATVGGGRMPRSDRLPLDPGDDERAAGQRLAVMASTNDGFVIAEADLRLRGPGDFFGTRQSGLPQFRVADPVADAALLGDARGDAFALVERDPHLTADDHRALADDLRATWEVELAIAEVG